MAEELRKTCSDVNRGHDRQGLHEDRSFQCSGEAWIAPLFVIPQVFNHTSTKLLETETARSGRSFSSSLIGSHELARTLKVLQLVPDSSLRL